MFTEIPGNFVLLQIGGVFKQAQVAKCTINPRVYVKHGGGYIRLGSGDSTSMPKVSRVCNYEEAPNVAVRDKFKAPEFVFPPMAKAA